MRYRNPVLPGFHPDPSVCRSGDSFYLITSSFHYFPGIPIWKSRDLVDWRLIGHGISRPEQIDLAGTAASRGLFAPTIRAWRGRFYITCAEVDRLGNFILSAPKPEGPWSQPIRLEVPGIDPSLFFDEDGTAYLCTGGDLGEDLGFGISLSVVDPDKGRILEGPRLATRGSGGRWPEGPHLHKRGGSYYLFMAEGGTEYGHMETVFRAASPWGPWEACPRNPVLSHRDDPTNPIQCVGHGDLVEDEEGGSWLLCLGVRPVGPPLHNLGRETFLAPVAWDSEGWPVVGNDGRLNLEMEGPFPGQCTVEADSRPAVESAPWPTENATSWPTVEAAPRPPMGAASWPTIEAAPQSPAGATYSSTVAAIGWSDQFTGPGLSLEWSFLRGRPSGIEVAPAGGLTLRGGKAGLSDAAATPAFVGRPQRAFDCAFETRLEFEPEGAESEAGVAAYYDDSYHYEAFITRRSRSRALCLRKRVHDIAVETAALPIAEHGDVLLRITANRERYEFSYECGDSSSVPCSGVLGSGLTAGLCTEGTWRTTFTGVFFGLYCVLGEALFFGSSCVDSAETALYP